MKNIKSAIIVIAAAFVLYSCSPPDGNYTGSEYMPDMGHSLAQESNVFSYYGLNTWDTLSTVKLKELANPGLPVSGTVPRGYAGVQLARTVSDKGKAEQVLAGGDQLHSISVPVNGSVPFYYGDSEEERTRAIAEVIDNPYPITADGLERGEDLYNKFCGICHGEKGDGIGYLVSEENPNVKYPAAPANFLLDEHLNASNGRYYYAIMYGKNVMGAYKDKISYEERWQVIHWIRALQAKENKLEYSETANTLNSTFGVPMAQVVQVAELNTEVEEKPHQGDSHGGGEHHDEHSGGEHHSDGNHGGDHH